MATPPRVLLESRIDSLPLIHRGKVRDIYDINDKEMLIVTSDRLSAFDVVLSQPIPGKGIVLTSVANKWFERTTDIIPNHLSQTELSDVLSPTEVEQVTGRAIIVKKLKPLPIEAIVRGYIIGSGWKDYQRSGSVCGIKLPEGLQLGEKLPEPIFTPSTKADVGDHDENISFDIMCDKIGKDMADKVKSASIALYSFAADFAREKGIIIADTKFEFGLDSEGNLVVIDEVLTPDSSRFWPADEYKVGMSPPSFDKQFVRDYLETLDWDKKAPAPLLPDEILEKTAEKYKEAETRLFS